MSIILTLPSNGSSTHFPDNTQASFTTHLSKPLNLKGEGWEVGLVELTYTNAFQNLKNAYVIIKKDLNENIVAKLDLPTGIYKKSQDVLDQIYRPVHQAAGSRSIVLAIDPITQHTALRLRFPGYVEMSPNLAGMLGFDNNRFYGPDKVYNSDRPFDINGGFFGIFVYCDLVEPVPVGDTLSSLMRIVPVEGKLGQVVTKTYNKIMYTPLTNRHSRDVKIDLRTDTGDLVPFTQGKVVVTLHIRRSTFLQTL